jgi:hypothetical protein
MPKAALLEIYDSHDVNLYSQLLFLQKGGYETTLIVSEAHRRQVAGYGLDHETQFCRVTDKKGLALWKELWRIRQLILDRGIEVVIFNTAHSNPVRNFCLLPFPKHIKFYGTLHGVNKLAGSLTQKIISRRIPNYYLLMDYMLEKALKMPHAGLRFSVFYPIFHQDFPEAGLPEKEPGHIWIAIPGSVEYKRRDYLSLLEAFAKVERKPDVRFFLLGNGYHPHGNGADLKARIDALGLGEYFIFFNGFVPDEVLHTSLRRCEAVMPLIHPINADMEKYLENQISGSFHRAFGYRKPLLLHDYYERYQDFRETGIFYNLESLSDFLSRLPQELEAFGEERYNNPKWSLDVQARNYCAFLESSPA